MKLHSVLQTEVKFNPEVLQPGTLKDCVAVAGALIPGSRETPVREARLESRETSPAHCLKIS